MSPKENFIPGGRRIPNPEGPPPPPLPDPIPDVGLQTTRPLKPIWFPVKWPPHLMLRALREGCYLITYMTKGSFLLHYDGTMRVQRDGENTIASGDLYFHKLWWKRTPISEPNPGAGIPIYERDHYSYYLRVTQILEWMTTANNFTLGFELHRFDQTNETWAKEGEFTALMTWITAPASYPSSSDYLSGEVMDSYGTVVGTLTMGWVSPYLRRAVVEIDKVVDSEWPANNGAGVDWRSIFDQVGWDVTVVFD